MKKKKTKKEKLAPVEEMPIVSRYPSCPTCYMGLPYFLPIEAAGFVFGYSGEMLWSLLVRGKLSLIIRPGDHGLEYHIDMEKTRDFPKRVHRTLSHVE